MNEDQTLPPTASPAGKRSRKYSRKVKLFVYGLCLILALIVIPAILVPPWLASKGIEINAISGIGFEQGLTIKEVSIAIQGNQMTFHQVSLAHFVEQQSAISNASWRLFAARSTIRLAPNLLRPLAEQGIELGHLTLTNTAFRFIHLSKPYLFSAHAEQIETTLTPAAESTHAKAPHGQKQSKGKAIQQRINNVDLVLSTQPKPVLSGFIGQGALTFMLPGDQNDSRYPFQFDHANFSLSWLTPQMPLTVHIRKLTPQWPTVLPDFSQIATNASFTMNLSQPESSISLSATQLHLDKPTQLPEFPSQSQQQPGLHLGYLISRLNQLPVRRIRIDDFRFGNWLSQAQLHFTPPGKDSPGGLSQGADPNTGTNTDKSNDTAKDQAPDDAHTEPYFQLRGTALAPTPFDLSVTLESDAQDRNQLQARLSDAGNHLACQVRLHTNQPLPELLQCQADVSDTRVFNDKLTKPDLPYARLTQPVTLSLTQLQQSTLTPGTLSEADYRLKLTWPEQLDIHLGKYALNLPGLFPAPAPGDAVQSRPGKPASIRQLSLSSSGELQLTARYRPQQLSLMLAEMKTPLTVSHRLGQAKVLLRQLGCTARVDAPYQTVFESLFDALQCHAESELQANLTQLAPQPDITLSNPTLSSALAIQWSNRTLTAQLRQNQLTADRLQLMSGTESSRLPAAFLSARADNLTLHNDKLELELAPVQGNLSPTSATQSAATAPLKFTLTAETPITLNADYEAEKLIGEPQPEQTQKKSRQPVQKYHGDVALNFRALSLRTLLVSPHGPQLTLDSDYQVQLNFQQNNQRFPPFHSHGHVQLEPESARLSGTLTNARQTPLLQFSLNSRLSSARTHIQLHRHKLHFSHHQSLKNHYLPLLPLNYNLTSGNVSLYADLVMEHQQLSGEFGLFTEHLQGHLQGFHFADVNASLTAEITPDGIRSKFPLSIRTEYLHVGLLLEDFIAQAEFDTGRNHYALHRASTRTLGGTVSTRGVSSRDLRNIDRIPIQIQHLDLQALIEMLAYPDIELTGILDGTLPLSVQDGLPVINSGRLHSRYPGGVLRYKSGSSIDQNIQASTSDSLKRISQILKNYKFDSLAVDVDYSKEGKLKASSRFKGANPDFQSGQPVYINLNIEDDIPALIKTMNAINSSKLEGQFLKQLGLDE